MICGKTSNPKKLTGTISSKQALSGSIGVIPGLCGTIAAAAPGKIVDVVYYETQNKSGGLTAFIEKKEM